MIIYKIQENGQATDFTSARKCPDGWRFIKLDDKIRRIEDINESDYHEQKYIDYLKSKEYIEKRKTEYPSSGDQFDYIYHNGVDAWINDIIKPIKEKYPKPA